LNEAQKAIDSLTNPMVCDFPKKEANSKYQSKQKSRNFVVEIAAQRCVLFIF